MKNLGKTSYWSKTKLYEEKIKQCKKIKQNLQKKCNIQVFITLLAKKVKMDKQSQDTSSIYIVSESDQELNIHDIQNDIVKCKRLIEDLNIN